MKVDALLCNHAEAVNNLLYISGGGIEFGMVPLGTPPPYAVNLAIGILVTVPWTGTNQQHKLEIELLTEDGKEVQVATGPDTTGAVRFELGFNVGRPAQISAGDDQHVALAANLPNLPLPAIGMYVFKVRVDNSDEHELRYRLTPQPCSAINFRGPAGTGPAAIPQL